MPRDTTSTVGGANAGAWVVRSSTQTGSKDAAPLVRLDSSRSPTGLKLGLWYVRVSVASEDYQQQAISPQFIRGKAGKPLVFHSKQATKLPGAIARDGLVVGEKRGEKTYFPLPLTQIIYLGIYNVVFINVYAGFRPYTQVIYPGQ